MQQPILKPEQITTIIRAKMDMVIIMLMSSHTHINLNRNYQKI